MNDDSLPPPSPRWRKRSRGFLLAGLILALGLFLLLARWSPPLGQWLNHRFPLLQSMASPGHLSAGHRSGKVSCPDCHQTTWGGVDNAACLHCHDRQAVHRHSRQTPEDHPEAPEARCTACHTGHNGKISGLHGRQAECVECHRTQASPLNDTHDFTRSHPAFAWSSQSREARFKFSHTLHLASKGVSSPQGNTTLHCPDCHRPGTQGTDFTPIDMARNCQQSRCHTLRFSAPAQGKIPHGPLAPILSRLQGLYVEQIHEDPKAFVSDCPDLKKTPTAPAVIACAHTLSTQYASKTLLQTEGKALQCALCHTVRQDDTGAPQISTPPAGTTPSNPIRQRTQFRHSKHTGLTCTHCHDMNRKQLGEPGALPDIALCRNCHSGTDSSGGDTVTSPCESCHHYHRHPSDTGKKPTP